MKGDISMKKVLAAAILLILALSFAACSNSGSGNNASSDGTVSSKAGSSAFEESTAGKNEKATEEVTEEVTEAQTEEPTETLTVGDYVYTKIEKNLPSPGSFLLTGEQGNGGELVPVRMPQLKLDSADAKRINNEITQDCASRIDDLEKSAPVHPSGRIDYAAYLNKNILSLIIEKRSADTPNSYFTVYNLDVTTGEEISYGKLVSLSDKSNDEVTDMLKNEITALFDKPLPSANASMADSLKNAKDKSLSDDNLSAAMYYFNGEGQLAVAYRYHWIAGAENYGALSVLNASVK